MHPRIRKRLLMRLIPSQRLPVRRPVPAAAPAIDGVIPSAVPLDLDPILVGLLQRTLQSLLLPGKLLHQPSCPGSQPHLWQSGGPWPCFECRCGLRSTDAETEILALMDEPV
jgi:hypothetical protein